MYWILLFSKLALYESVVTSEETPTEIPISVVICARNEADNLKKNLPLILNQNYRSFEIIVVNDASNDNTANVLLDFAKKYPYLRIIEISNKKKIHVGKKYALTQGIKAASYDTLLLTDADCAPASAFWIQKVQWQLRGGIEIGLGYGPYNNAPTWLNQFVQYETIYTAIQYFSFALAGMPYMGVGRNMIYHKHLFEQANGFESHQHIASGDDDLLMRDVATKKNVRIVLDADTFMFSEAKSTWRAYFKQKTRHLSTATAYKWKHKLLLGGLSASHFLHYLGIFSLILKFSIIFAGFIYVVRIGVVIFMYAQINNKLGRTLKISKLPILDAVYVFYYLIFLPSFFTGKNNQWT